MKVHAAAFERITPPPASSFTCRRIEGTSFEAPYHYHPELELTWIIRSAGQRFVGDSMETFHSGDLLLLGPNVPHVWLNSPGCRRAEALVVQFLPDFLGAAFFDLPEMRGVRRLLERSARGVCFSPGGRKKVSSRLDQLAAQSGPIRLASLLTILSDLALDRRATPLCSARYAFDREFGTDGRIDAILRDLMQKFRETVFQADFARSAGLSPAAFSRYFRRMTGRSFTEVVSDLRLGHACELLRDTTQSVAELCYASGFENLANFNRQFRRRHRVSPREWRRLAARER